MRPYLLSLGAGVLVGVVYALLKVRSPAPPVIALVGLLGILIGEQAVPLVKKLFAGEAVTTSWIGEHLRGHSLGQLPAQTAPPVGRKQDSEAA